MITSRADLTSRETRRRANWLRWMSLLAADAYDVTPAPDFGCLLSSGPLHWRLMNSFGRLRHRQTVLYLGLRPHPCELIAYPVHIGSSSNRAFEGGQSEQEQASDIDYLIH